MQRQRRRQDKAAQSAERNESLNHQQPRLPRRPPLEKSNGEGFTFRGTCSSSCFRTCSWSTCFLLWPLPCPNPSAWPSRRSSPCHGPCSTCPLLSHKRFPNHQSKP